MHNQHKILLKYVKNVTFAMIQYKDKDIKKARR
jgi:hypothetical protein